LVIALVIIAVPIVFSIIPVASASRLLSIWLAGAAALGLLSGFTTGASKQPGISGEFIKFLSGGILVPLTAAIATALKGPATTTETYEYLGELVAKKVTEVTTPPQMDLLSPLSVLGSFFVVYSLLAILGILLGASQKKKSDGIVLEFYQGN